MKKAFCVFTILLTLAVSVLAQEAAPVLNVDEVTKLITYKEVVQVEGSKIELFNRAIEWINKFYKNPADATTVREPQTGLIEIIHRIELSYNEKGVTRPAGVVDYHLRLELKDGRYRYIITNFNLKQASRLPIEKWMNKADKTYTPSWDHYLFQVDDFTKKLIANLKAGMLPPVTKKEESW